MLQAPVFDGLAFDPFSAVGDGLRSLSDGIARLGNALNGGDREQTETYRRHITGRAGQYIVRELDLNAKEMQVGQVVVVDVGNCPT